MFGYIFFAAILLTLQIGGSISQIITTNRLKNADDLSGITVVLFYGGVLFSLPYSFGLNFPLPYKIGFMGQLIAVSYMLGQSYRYRTDLHDSLKHKVQFWGAVGGITIIGIALSIFTYYYREMGGNIAGWLCVSALSLRSIPQIIRMFRRKSSQGVSTFNAYATVFAAMSHIFLAVYFKLPIQIMLNYGRLLVLSIIQLLQLLYYRRKKV